MKGYIYSSKKVESAFKSDLNFYIDCSIKYQENQNNILFKVKY